MINKITNKVAQAYNIYKRNLIDSKRRRQQENYFDKYVDKKAERLIIFLIEGPWQKGETERISGGITSIESIYQRTRELKSLHKAETLLCILSGNPLFEFSTFTSKSRILQYEQSAALHNVKEVLFHIPEYLAPQLLSQLKSGKFQQHLEAKYKQLNILNQNIYLMPEPALIHQLEEYFDKVTQTTAHKNYNSDEFLGRYSIPYHFFSARVDINQYKFVPFEQKENLVLFSPDDLQKNKRLKELLQPVLKGYKFQTIQNMNYDEYKERIGKAKFCFTFGEGLDGYFIEPFFSGTISFAIYNNEFFRAAYKELPSVFNTEEELFSTIATEITKLLKPVAYNNTVAKTNALLTADYNYNDYVNNIKEYYNLYFKSAS